jgi:hypothetical protein
MVSFRHESVVGPEQVPKVIDREKALSAPDLTMLSMLAHGAGDVETATMIGSVAYDVAYHETNRDRQALYLGLIDQALSPQAKDRLQMKLAEMKFPPHSYLEGKQEGRAEGQANAVLLLLAQRGIAVDEAQRHRIATCTDLRVIGDWLARVLTVRSVDDLLRNERASPPG